MIHLCIINPMAGLIKGRVGEIEDEIKNFFSANPRMKYDIHITRWKRDASGYVLRYANNVSELLRVYVFGGTGTFFEVLNGLVGLPNVQVAWYPLGIDNTLLAVFGKDKLRTFQSLKNLCLSPVKTIDTILAGNHNVITNVLIGIEANSYLKGRELSEQFRLPRKICNYLMDLIYFFLKPEINHYRIDADSVELDGNLLGILITNIPNHVAGTPVEESGFNDGFMDLYIIKPIPKSKIISVVMDYERGRYAKWPEFFCHYRCKKLRVSSSSDMTISLDGELFFDTEFTIEIRPSSLDFVYPPDIDESILSQIPETAAVSGKTSDFRLEDFSPEDFQPEGSKTPAALNVFDTEVQL